MAGSVACSSVQGITTSITKTQCFTVLSPGKADATLSGGIFFFFSPMSGISSRICSFIFHDSKQNGSLRGGSFRNTTFCDASVLKGSACQFRRHKSGFDPWVRKIPWRRKWQPTPLKLPRKFHGQSSLAGYSTGGGGPQKVGHN